MCFRPPTAAKPVECPSCGKKVPFVGVKQTNCPFCKEELPQKTEQPTPPPKEKQ